MFKIDIVNFLIIHIVIDFNANHHSNFEWIIRKLWTYVYFWNDNTTFVTQKNEKCGLKKYIKIISK
jgi:hypothetical protein